MVGMSRDPSDMRPRQTPRPPGPGTKPPEPGWRWIVIVVIGLLLATVVLPLLIHGGGKSLSYADFKAKVDANDVATANINNNDGHISGKLQRRLVLHGDRSQPGRRQRDQPRRRAGHPRRQRQLPHAVEQPVPQPAADHLPRPRDGAASTCGSGAGRKGR